MFKMPYNPKIIQSEKPRFHEEIFVIEKKSGLNLGFLKNIGVFINDLVGSAKEIFHSTQPLSSHSSTFTAEPKNPNSNSSQTEAVPPIQIPPLKPENLEIINQIFRNINEELIAKPRTAPAPKPQIKPATILPDPYPVDLKDYNLFGRIISESIEEKGLSAIRMISNVFHLLAFCYTTLTLAFLSIFIALAISLTNAGAPGFVFLKYYPRIGMLPLTTCIFAVIFMLVAFKVRDRSRLSWFLAMITLTLIPLSSTIFLPALAYPLIKLVAVYAGTPDKPILSPSINLPTLSRYFSSLMFFELTVIFLLISMNKFRLKPSPLPANARTSLKVILVLLFFPISAIVSYSYFDMIKMDYGYRAAAKSVNYHLYAQPESGGTRVKSTNFLTNEALADYYDAVRVTYDAPLPSLIQSGQNSPINVKQVGVRDNFGLRSFVDSQPRTDNTSAEEITIPGILIPGYLITYKGENKLYFIMPDKVLIEISSAHATTEEMLNFAGELK